MNRKALRAGQKERDELEELLEERTQKEEAIIPILQNAAEEIEAAGELPQEVRKKTLAIDPLFDRIWTSTKSMAEEMLKAPDVSMCLELFDPPPEERSRLLAAARVAVAIAALKKNRPLTWGDATEVATAQHIIPDEKSLNKILRYEAAIERQLGSIANRLERLQRRRQGEMIPPPVSVELT